VGVPGLIHLLKVRYGGTVGGWTMGVDRIGTGRLSWMMFCKGCRNIGFIGNFRQVWDALDDDGSGTVSLMELDPPAGAALLEFRDMMVQKFTVVVEGWNDLASGLGHIDKKAFVKKMKEYGYKQNPAKLFEWLKIERCNHVLFQPDIGIVNRIFPQVKPLPWSPDGGPHGAEAEAAAAKEPTSPASAKAAGAVKADASKEAAVEAAVEAAKRRTLAAAALEASTEGPTASLETAEGTSQLHETSTVTDPLGPPSTVN